MRVSSGAIRGQSFDAPKGFRTRPMADRVKTALFNTLGDISGMRVLDAYAGSGSLAFEALSRGAAFAQLVETNQHAFKVISQNIIKLRLEERAKVTKANISSWCNRNKDEVYDLILCDPPYDQQKESVLEKIALHLSEDGTFVLSHLGSAKPPELEGLELVSSRKYGDAALAYYTTVKH